MSLSEYYYDDGEPGNVCIVEFLPWKFILDAAFIVCSSVLDELLAFT